MESEIKAIAATKVIRLNNWHIIALSVLQVAVGVLIGLVIDCGIEKALEVHRIDQGMIYDMMQEQREINRAIEILYDTNNELFRDRHKAKLEAMEIKRKGY